MPCWLSCSFTPVRGILGYKRALPCRQDAGLALSCRDDAPSGPFITRLRGGCLLAKLDKSGSCPYIIISLSLARYQIIRFRDRVDSLCPGALSITISSPESFICHVLHRSTFLACGVRIRPASAVSCHGTVDPQERWRIVLPRPFPAQVPRRKA